MDELVQWREFYAAVAGAAAALIGLVYVGISIQLGRHAGDEHMRLFGTMSAQNFLHPLIVALAMLLPVEPVVQAGLLLMLGVAGLVNTLSTSSYELRHPQPVAGGERRLMTVYRYGMTLAASAVLVAGAVGLLAGWRPAIYAPGLFVFLMFLVGVENAWALLLGTAAATTDGVNAAHPAHSRRRLPGREVTALDEPVRGMTATSRSPKPVASAYDRTSADARRLVDRVGAASLVHSERTRDARDAATRAGDRRRMGNDEILTDGVGRNRGRGWTPRWVAVERGAQLHGIAAPRHVGVVHRRGVAADR